MNAVVELPSYQSALVESRERFNTAAPSSMKFGDEEIFAMQMLTKNDYVFGIANKAPNSVHMAMLNVASTGLTLNPAMGYAYLVPRDGAIHLDISYKGLIKIATDSGAIEWVRAEVVHENDSFEYHGPAKMPEIQCNPFKPRGEIVGAYCIAKTASGDVLTEVMDLAALHKVRSASTAYTKGGQGRKGPWEDYFAEMARKAVIKRARKTWPYSGGSNERMALAVEIANKAEGGYVFEGGDTAALSHAGGTSEEQVALQAAKRKAAHDDAHGRHSESVDFIKDRIAADDMQAVADEWRAIPEDDQMALWLATSKGGCFTTAERKAIKERMPSKTTKESNA